MANGNGRFFKWAAGSLLTMVLGLVALGAEQTLDSIDSNRRNIDTLEAKVQVNTVEQAKIVLQLAEIAKAFDIPVVVDTAAADSAVRRDST